MRRSRRDSFRESTPQASKVADDPVVRVVATQLLAELLMLQTDRLVQVRPAPARDRLQPTFQSALRRLALHHPSASMGSAPVMGESQEVECARLGTIPSLAGGVARGRRLEPDQPRLLRVDRQAVLAHPPGQDVHDPSGVVFSGHPDHEVVRIANQERLSFQARANLRLEPVVEHVVQDDIGQERTDHSALRSAGLGARESPILQHPRVEPLADQAQDHPVAHPTLEELPEMAVVDRVEEPS